MELLPFLRILWQLRLLVAAGLIASLAAAYVLGSRPVVRSGSASVEVMLDTPHSELVSPDPSGSDSLAWRSQILVHSMLTDQARENVARTMGVPANRVVLIDLALRSPAILTTLPIAAADAGTRYAPYSLGLVADINAPIISLQARAPDLRGAAKLIDAAVKEMQAHAPAANSPDLQPFTAERITDTQLRLIESGGSKVIAVAAAIFLFGAWCMFLVVAVSLLRLTRRQLDRTPVELPAA